MAGLATSQMQCEMKIHTNSEKLPLDPLDPRTKQYSRDLNELKVHSASLYLLLSLNFPSNIEGYPVSRDYDWEMNIRFSYELNLDRFKKTLT